MSVSLGLLSLLFDYLLGSCDGSRSMSLGSFLAAASGRSRSSREVSGFDGGNRGILPKMLGNFRLVELVLGEGESLALRVS